MTWSPLLSVEIGSIFSELPTRQWSDAPHHARRTRSDKFDPHADADAWLAATPEERARMASRYEEMLRRRVAYHAQVLRTAAERRIRVRNRREYMRQFRARMSEPAKTQAKVTRQRWVESRTPEQRQKQLEAMAAWRKSRPKVPCQWCASLSPNPRFCSRSCATSSKNAARKKAG